MAKNLFLCRSPLQLEIVLNIIKRVSSNDAIILYVDDEFKEDNHKNFLRFSSDEVKLIYYHKRNRPLDLLFFIHILDDYDTIYLASVSNTYFQFLISHSSYNSIVTFDDGTASLMHDSMIHNSKCSFAKMMFKKMFFIHEDNASIISKSSHHFTIYNFGRYLYKVPYTYVDLFEKPTLTCDKNSDKPEVSIFLGGCYSELVEALDYESFLITLSNFIIDLKSENQCVYYIPHPREKCDQRIFSIVNPIYPQELTEYYLLNLLDSYSIVKLYGFGSSVQLNLVRNPRVQVNILKHTDINNKYDTELLFSNFEYETIRIG
ncbi:MULTISPECIES: glycosyltransferase family 52 [unclassified Vibrio]|uniref:glycosyltransferase family 52 n=1 Tax=unclassified Vibrio TaxID=2614977 RepID=UPI00354AF16D